jgi:hypothetical protein
VNETNHFFNLGYGWLCKHCSAEDSERAHSTPTLLMQQGDAQYKNPKPAALALASWTDATGQTLVCARCSIEEMISKK